MVSLVRLADPGIAEFKRRDLKDAGILAPQHTYDVLHSCDGEYNRLNIEELSSGTLKWLDSIDLIVDTVRNGGIAVIDEIDIQLHPHLIETLLALFHTRSSALAQLIFTTHSTYPLRQKRLRRDQVWFVNKQSDLSSDLVNFSEFKVRPDASYEKDYLNGRYGGIPWTDLSEIMSMYADNGQIAGVMPQ
jgi:AAA15 family ATPase/GTPase